jgi:hypothetical protein
MHPVEANSKQEFEWATQLISRWLNPEKLAMTQWILVHHLAAEGQQVNVCKHGKKNVAVY